MKEKMPLPENHMEKSNGESNEDEIFSRWSRFFSEKKIGKRRDDFVPNNVGLREESGWSEVEIVDYIRSIEPLLSDLRGVKDKDQEKEKQKILDALWRAKDLVRADRTDRTDGGYVKPKNFIKAFLDIIESKEAQKKMEDVHYIKDKLMSLTGHRKIPLMDVDEIKSELEKIIRDIEKLKQAERPKSAKE